MKVLVTGGRDYDNYAKVVRELDYHAHRGARFIVGDCPHRSGCVRAVLPIRRRFPFVEFLADWAEHGKAAGPIRNQAMIDDGPDLVIAFPGGKGTADCVRRARAAGIEVQEVS